MGDKLSMADVPLGPYAGSLITVHSAKGTAANLHASKRCGQLRTSDVRTVDVPLETEALSRLCSRCAAWGAWGRSTTGLGMFLRALGGMGLLYQLQSYTEPDEDECWTDDEARDAAALLRAERDIAGDDDEDVEGDTSLEEAREDAERLRDLIFTHWRGAGRSLNQIQAVLTHFPWLVEWAKPSLTAKMRYLETLRAQAARFVDLEELLVAAAATTLSMPELPRADSAFAVLGSSRVSTALVDLWRRWQSAAGRLWEGPGARSYLSYEIVRDIRSNRKSYDAARAKAAHLIESWEGQARAAVASAHRAPTRRLTAHVPEAFEETARHDVWDFLDGLDAWTLGVLVTWTVRADWGNRVLMLEVPGLVAERLLGPTSDLPCSPAGEAAHRPEGDGGPVTQPGVVRPGVFDDTPVFDRRPVTLDHIRALRTLSPGADQLYLIFSASGGAEVLPLATIERRLAKGWLGVLIAGASDLPGSLICSEEPGSSSEPGARDAQRPGPGQSAQDRQFGEDLGLAEGGRRTLQHTYGTEDRDMNVRLLALARGAYDLRSLDAGRSGGLPVAVWHGLLTEDHLDLVPFLQPGSDRWRSGSGLPLGLLAGVQLYTTNADPRIEGKGHSPLCRHAHERAVVASDDLITVADLMARTDFDWCSKCGGYAIRRLTGSQLSYYRAAHRLHDIRRRLDGRSGTPDIDTSTLSAHLEELAAWEPADEEEWCSSDSWQWLGAIRELRRKAERSHAVTSTGEPAS
ncbi:hypothetical protein [Streptomyces sp. V1I1]|uniref:hypothetical protein n=1 Tax=Streptomyces sp. V1I1 TaxID=3042272 RepID=UPI0027D7C356|nr:hypothetical protein [Streptomyces sp. V1I1]